MNSNARVVVTKILLFGFLVILGCRGQERRLSDWHKSVDPPLWIGGKKLHQESFFEVASSNKVVIKSALSDSSFKKIEGHLSSLMPKNAIFQEGEWAFLVRAIRSDNATGGFSLWEKDGNLQIHFGALGELGPCYETGLIVFLDAPPKEVFVTAEAAR